MTEEMELFNSLKSFPPDKVGLPDNARIALTQYAVYILAIATLIRVEQTLTA